MSDKSLLKRVQVALYLGIGSFVVNLIIELTGSQASNTPLGQTIGRLALIATPIVVPLALAFLFFLWLRRRRAGGLGRRNPPDPIPEPPAVLEPWIPPEPLIGRRDEVADAVSRVLETGVVAVVGARDIGTSDVAAAVVQELIDRHGGEPDHTYRFDLRSRSTTEPYDAIATAGRVVSAFDIDEPSDDTGEVLARAANQLIDRVARQGGILLLDNVSMSEQVGWLVREWPSGGWPRLVIAGEKAVGDAVERSRVEVGELSLAHLREIWDHELGVPEPGLRQRIMAKLIRTRRDAADPVDELLRACLGRPRAVRAFTDEIRSDSSATAENLAAAIRAEGPVGGPLERVWTAILDNISDGLSTDAALLLDALAELPVTGLTRGAVAAVLGSDDLAPLEELRERNLVREQAGRRYRLPTEIRTPIIATRPPERRHEVALRVVPALVDFYAESTELWAVRLDTDAKHARAWFRNAEPTLRALFGEDLYLDDDLLARALDGLGVIADALESWYVREQQSRGLLEVNRGLYALVHRMRREDLAALAAIRMATAQRLAGRPGEAAARLEVAHGHVQAVADDRIWSELDTRMRVEVALLVLTAAEPARTELDEAIDGLDERTRVPEVLIDLGALYLARGLPDEALVHLERAERLAADQRDVGCEAHAVELRGIALSQRDGRLVDAVRLWQRALTMFERTGEDRGMARCLQHIGSAALVDVRVAGLLRAGHPVALAAEDAAAVAIEPLERAKHLRTGQPDTELVDHYLAEAGRHLVTVAIYLSDEAGNERVEAAVIKLLEQVGSRVVHQDDPRQGSWSKRLFASRGSQETIEALVHLLESQTVLAQDAKNTNALMENLGPVIQSLESIPKAAIRLGAVLIVKSDGVLTVQQLTVAQQNRLNHQPHLLWSPDTILNALAAAAHEPAALEAPDEPERSD